jgi:hypothetical protein
MFAGAVRSSMFRRNPVTFHRPISKLTPIRFVADRTWILIVDMLPQIAHRFLLPFFLINFSSATQTEKLIFP